MQIKLINCNIYLLDLGINMDEIGSGAQLSDKVPGCESWEYDYGNDALTVVFPEETEVPETVYELGEVVTDDNSSG